jgi:hypothetical protein
MGTRADFYVASGDNRMDLQLEYLGTISSDGREIGDVEDATTEQEFRDACAALFRERRGAKFPKVNSLNTDFVFVWVPGIGIVYRTTEYDENDPESFIAAFDKTVDDGEDTYISLTLANEWHQKGIASRDDEDGEYTIPEWDSYWGFNKVAKVEGIRYRYPDNRNNTGVVVSLDA